MGPIKAPLIVFYDMVDLSLSTAYGYSAEAASSTREFNPRVHLTTSITPFVAAASLFAQVRGLIGLQISSLAQREFGGRRSAQLQLLVWVARVDYEITKSGKALSRC